MEYKAEEQLSGRVETVTFQNEETGFAVLTIANEQGDLVSVVGPLAGSAPGEQLLLVGRYVEHREYGRQFEATACSYRLPEDESAILQYLGSGILPGIGPATARRIVERFGTDSLEVLANAPEKLAAMRGMTIEKAREAGRKFLKVYGVREAVATLSRLGLSASEALAVYRHRPQETALIQTNPYLLCGPPLYLAFARADAIAQQFALEPDSVERQQAALLYTLRHNQGNGHTCLPRERLVETASTFFGIPAEALLEQLDFLSSNGELQQVDTEEGSFVYLPQPLHDEMLAALRIRALAAAPARTLQNFDKQLRGLQDAHGIQYAPLQKEAIRQALSSGVTVITGGPGTGKTTIVNAIIALYEQQTDRVLLAAPTGRAAKRLSELTGRPASTIHRLLEVEYTSDGREPFFKRNEKNPLRCEVLILDELSMVDAMLFERVLAGIKPGCRLVLVGDANQLPSVGPGNVLRGILDSGTVPVVALNEIFRQAAASLIVANAHRIVSGQAPQRGGKQDDFFMLQAFGADCQQLVCDLASARLPAGYGFDPVRDIQLLCPSRKGLLGTEIMGARLQQLLNPPAAEKPEMVRAGMTFRLGDKVIQTRNNYDISFTRTNGEPGTGAFNGDIGYIEEMEPAKGRMTVLCEDRHVYYTTDNLHELELAYAITIHKSQGSEFEAVIIPVTDVPAKLRYRNLLYTGVTRARRLCILAGEESVVEQMVRNGRRNIRYSCFAHFLQDEELV